MKGYDLLTSLSLLISYLYTKIHFKRARLIRLPVVVRNKKLIQFSDGFTSGKYCRIDAFNHNNEKVLKFGIDCQINDSVHIAAASSITIGDNVLIASRVFISDHNHGCYSGDIQSNPKSIASKREISTNPVLIENNVWIGEGVSILPGSHIGCNSIIGANSVVNGEIPKNSIAVGIPAKVVKKYCDVQQRWIKVESVL